VEGRIFAFHPENIMNRQHAARLLPLFALSVLAVACEKKAPPPPPPPPPAAKVWPVDPVAPDSFRAKFETSKGTFVIELHRAWSPKGVDRFNRLITEKYFDDERFFRVMKGFVAQFGMHGDPATNAKWSESKIQDEPVTQSNTRGMITFAIGGRDTRSNQFFINLVDNAQLNSMGFSPIGKVVQGMSVVDALYSGYGDGAPEGKGPAQDSIRTLGNAYLKKDFPKLDYIKHVTVSGAPASK
jgi:peptidyl-prolyl cis-trans isomerase A (cyclophilin A)